MKYYQVNRQIMFENEGRILTNANGEFVPNGKSYFDRIGNGEIIKDAPVFDYFHLQGRGSQEPLDFFPLFYVNGSGTVISERLKMAIEDEENGVKGFLFTELEYEIEVMEIMN